MSLLFQPVTVEDHVSHTKRIRGWSLVDRKSFITDLVIFVFTDKGHFVTLYLNVTFTSSAVPDIADTGTIAEDLNSILS
jgi:hypothetical protein